MTIQVVDITKFGIVMAADGAISFSRPSIGPRRPKDWRRRKLLQIPNLHAVIGYFGLAEIGNKPLDQWLEKFIHENVDVVNSDDFSQGLAEALSAAITRAESRHKLGFHLGCYRVSPVGRIPEMHFIRNYQGVNAIPSQHFVATEEVLGNHYRQLGEQDLLSKLGNGLVIFFQNGYHEVYNAIAMPLLPAFEQVIWRNQEFVDPPRTVRGWGTFTEFRLRVVRLVFEKFHKRRGHQPVGGRLSFVAIPASANEAIEA